MYYITERSSNGYGQVFAFRIVSSRDEFAVEIRTRKDAEWAQARALKLVRSELGPGRWRLTLEVVAPS